MIVEGEIGGERYQLLAFTEGGHNYLKLCKWSCGYGLTQGVNYFGYQFGSGDGSESDDVDEYGLLVDGPFGVDEAECTKVLRERYSENICRYSEEEAGKLALQYAALFSNTDMAIAKTNWRMTVAKHELSSPEEDNSLEWEPNGYVFYLQRQYGNLSCNESNFWWREVTNTGKEIALKADPLEVVAEQECYRVEVTNEGVIFADSIEPWYEVTKALSDSTSLMDFADIENLAKGYFEEMVKDGKESVSTRKNIIRIVDVKLRYATVCYDGEYTLIPCWFFNKSKGANALGYGEGQATVMVINAIDGSKVFFRRID